MALSSHSTTSIRSAVDSILNEFCKYDEDREKWVQEKLRLEKEINCFKQQLEDKDKEYSILLKRYKVLELSIKSNQISKRKNNDLFNDNLIAMRPNNIKLKLKSKRRNKQTWSATLPTSLSPQRIMNLLDDFSGQWNKEKEENEEEKEEEKEKQKVKEKETQKAEQKEKQDFKEEQQSQQFKLQLSPNMPLRHHLDCVRCLCLNDDESVLISGSDDGTIKLWDLSKVDVDQHRMAIPITFRGHTSSVSCCSVVPNSNTLITAGFDNNLFGWRLPLNGTVLMEMESLSSLRSFEMKQHSDIIWDISPNYSLPIVSSISSDNTMKIFNIERHEVVTSYNLSAKYISPTSVQWNNFVKERLVISSLSGHIILFDATKESKVSDILDKSSTYCINKIYCDDNFNSSLVYAACSDSRVRVFDLNSNKCIISQKVHTDSVTSMVIHSSSSSVHVLTSSHDSRLRVWDFRTTKLSCIQDLEPQDTHPQKWDEGLLCMAFNNAYKWLFSGGSDGIKLYQTNL